MTFEEIAAHFTLNHLGTSKVIAQFIFGPKREVFSDKSFCLEDSECFQKT